MSPILEVRDLSVNFNIYQNRKWPWSPPHVLRAVNKVSFALEKGTTLGVVGESGCGKSTLIRAICGLNPPTSGEVILDGKPVDYQSSSDRKRVLNSMQMIFQDPVSSLNPRMTVKECVMEPLRAFFPDLSTDEREKRFQAMMDRVGIARTSFGRYPHEFSGGQCQRIGIARALVSEPKILLCDEPVSALDVSIQAQVVNLLKELQNEMGLSMIFVAHDLGVVRHISDNTLVLYLGQMMEYADAKALTKHPQHPYTKALLSAVPVPNPKEQVQPELLKGELPSPLDPPKGCPFSTRCPRVIDACRAERPSVETMPDGALVACIRARETAMA